MTTTDAQKQGKFISVLTNVNHPVDDGNLTGYYSLVYFHQTCIFGMIGMCGELRSIEPRAAWEMILHRVSGGNQSELARMLHVNDRTVRSWIEGRKKTQPTTMVAIRELAKNRANSCQ